MSLEVFEFRQYTLQPGRRDELIALFERELITAQEDCGMRMHGRYRDLDDPDRFVWVRSFPDVTRRAAALSCFYDGPVWADHQVAANATMIDSDNVLLLREPWRGSFDDAGSDRVVATIWSYPESLPALDPAEFAGGVLVTADVPNDFPQLPVRTGEHVVLELGGKAAHPPPAPLQVLNLQRVQ